MDLLSSGVLYMENKEREIVCVFCGEMIISKHIKIYMCDECYKDHNTGV